MVSVTFPVRCVCWHKRPWTIYSLMTSTSTLSSCRDVGGLFAEIGTDPILLPLADTLYEDLLCKNSPITLQALWNWGPSCSFMEGPLPVILPHIWLIPYLHSFRQGQVKRALSKEGWCRSLLSSWSYSLRCQSSMKINVSHSVTLTVTVSSLSTVCQSRVLMSSPLLIYYRGGWVQLSHSVLIDVSLLISAFPFLSPSAPL